jgi:hypothetical protein
MMIGRGAGMNSRFARHGEISVAEAAPTARYA